MTISSFGHGKYQTQRLTTSAAPQFRILIQSTICTFFEESMIICETVEVETTSFPLLSVDYPKSFRYISTTARKEHITKFTQNYRNSQPCTHRQKSIHARDYAQPVNDNPKPSRENIQPHLQLSRNSLQTALWTTAPQLQEPIYIHAAHKTEKSYPVSINEALKHMLHAHQTKIKYSIPVTVILHKHGCHY